MCVYTFQWFDYEHCLQSLCPDGGMCAICSAFPRRPPEQVTPKKCCQTEQFIAQLLLPN